MKKMIAALALAFVACLSIFGEEVRTNAPTEQAVHASKGTRVWISSFATGSSPITLSIEQRDWPAYNAQCTPMIPADICRQWRTNYPVFRKLLISAAEKAHLDSTSLAKVIPELDPSQTMVMAILPVEVQSAEVKGQLAWVVTYRWEYVRDLAWAVGLDHIRADAFAQRTLKQVWGMQCD